MLDSPQACVQELSECGTALAKFGYDWAHKAGELKNLTIQQERLVRAALLKSKGSSKEVREAQAHAAVAEQFPDLQGEIENLERWCADYAIRFKALDKRASIAQSVLAAYRAEAKMGDYAITEPAWSSRD